MRQIANSTPVAGLFIHPTGILGVRGESRPNLLQTVLYERINWGKSESYINNCALLPKECKSVSGWILEHRYSPD